MVRHKKTETTARKWGRKAAKAEAWTAMLEAPLWTAPWCQPLTPPTTGCAGRPLPLRTSCLVLAGRSPGLEEPPLYNRFPSLSLLFLPFSLSFLSLSLSHIIFPFPAVVLCHLSFANFLNVSIFLSFISSLYLFVPPLPFNPLSRSSVIFLLFSLNHCWPLSFLSPYPLSPNLLCVLLSTPLLSLTLRTFFLCTHHTRPPVQCVNNLRALHDSLNSSMRTSTNCQDSLAEPTLRSLLEKTTHGFSLVSVSCYWTWKGGLVDITAIGSEPGRHLEQSAPIKDQQSP